MNYGFNPQLEREHQKGNEWTFGSTGLTCIAEIPEDQREKFLPVGENQNIGSEKMDCATRGPNNILEAKLTYLIRNELISDENLEWLYENGYIVFE